MLSRVLAADGWDVLPWVYLIEEKLLRAHVFAIAIVATYGNLEEVEALAAISQIGVGDPLARVASAQQSERFEVQAKVAYV